MQMQDKTFGISPMRGLNKSVSRVYFPSVFFCLKASSIDSITLIVASRIVSLFGLSKILSTSGIKLLDLLHALRYGENIEAIFSAVLLVVWKNINFDATLRIC